MKFQLIKFIKLRFWQLKMLGLLMFFMLGLVTVESAPFERRMVDLTHVFDNDTLHYPAMKKFEIKIIMNGTFNEKYWLQYEEYNSAIHVGTHMDAPCHFSKGRWTVDEIPLHRLVAPAAVVDISEKAEANRDYQVTIDDLKRWEFETGQFLNKVILMIRSGWSKRWGDKERFMGTAGNDITQLHFPGIAPEAARWLADERNVYGVGVETLSLDYGPARENLVHHIMLAKNVFFLENVANFDELPPYGAKLYVMPMKIGKASGAPTRIIATIPEWAYSRFQFNRNFNERFSFNG